VGELTGADQQHKFLVNSLKLEERTRDRYSEVEAAPLVILDQGMGNEAVTALLIHTERAPAVHQRVSISVIANQ
jgi:hypothetical protein